MFFSPVLYEQCFVLTFIYVLLLPAAQREEAWEHSWQHCSIGSRRALDRKVLSLIFVHQRI